MIEYLYANNYKSFVNFKIKFSQLDLLIGKNGVGKSNVFALAFSLLELVRGNNNAMRIFFVPITKTRWMNSNIQTFEMGFKDDEHKYIYKVEMEQDIEKMKSRIFSERITCDDHVLYQMIDGNAVLYDDNFVGTSVLTDNTISGISFAPIDGSHKLLNGFKNVTHNILFCFPDPKAMSDIVDKDDFGPKVNFSNIATIYADMIQTNTEVYSDLLGSLRDIYPALKRFNIQPSLMGKQLRVEYEYNGVSCLYNFNELSDGEKMTFALYILLYCYVKKGATVFLDEPDNYLSLREIQPWCSAMEGEITSTGQCIMISHHPEIIDYLAEANGVWMSRLNSGESVIIENLQDRIENKELLKYSELIARGILDEAY